MPGEMNLRDALSGHASGERIGFEMMIDAVHRDIIHIEQQQTIRLSAEFVQKLPFAHFRPSKADVARNIVEQNAHTEKLSNLLDPQHQMGECLLDIGHGDQIV